VEEVGCGQVAEDGLPSCGNCVAKKTWETWAAKLGKLSGPAGRRLAMAKLIDVRSYHCGYHRFS
jgi:hypothetical protein